jgi:hypothetical protein
VNPDRRLYTIWSYLYHIPSEAGKAPASILDVRRVSASVQLCSASLHYCYIRDLCTRYPVVMLIAKYSSTESNLTAMVIPPQGRSLVD